MITEDYVSFETAKLLKKKGFEEFTYACFTFDGDDLYGYRAVGDDIMRPTLQMVMNWLEEVHHILVIPDYIYECTDTSWVYKIYRLGENGKPERCVVKGVSYDDGNNPTEHIVGYRDYDMSEQEYATRREAVEEGIKYCLKNLI